MILIIILIYDPYYNALTSSFTYDLLMTIISVFTLPFWAVFALTYDYSRGFAIQYDP